MGQSCLNSVTQIQEIDFNDITMPDENAFTITSHNIKRQDISVSQLNYQLEKYLAKLNITITQFREFQNQLNSHPLIEELRILYNKCRIERPVNVGNGIYIGQWHSGEFCGYGKLFYKDGSYYEGYWFMGKKHHVGIHFNQTLQEVQNGEWFADQFLQNVEPTTSLMFNYKLEQMESQMIQIDNDCQNNQDNLINKKFNGYRIMKVQNEMYQGQFKNNLKHGIGHLMKDNTFSIHVYKKNQIIHFGFSIQF